MTTTLTPPPENNADYSSIAAQQTAAARKAELELWRDKLGEFRQLVNTNKFSVIKGAQLVWEMGDAIQRITGHQKLSPQEFEKYFLASESPPAGTGSELSTCNLQPATPLVPIGFAKECVAARMRYETAPTEFPQAKLVFDAVLEQLELLPANDRGEQTRHPHEPVNDFLAEAIRLSNHCRKIMDEVKAERIPLADVLRLKVSIIRQTQPVAEMRAWLEEQN